MRLSAPLPARNFGSLQVIGMPINSGRDVNDDDDVDVAVNVVGDDGDSDDALGSMGDRSSLIQPAAR